MLPVQTLFLLFLLALDWAGDPHSGTCLFSGSMRSQAALVLHGNEDDDSSHPATQFVHQVCLDWELASLLEAVAFCPELIEAACLSPGPPLIYLYMSLRR